MPAALLLRFGFVLVTDSTFRKRSVHDLPGWGEGGLSKPRCWNYREHSVSLFRHSARTLLPASAYSELHDHHGPVLPCWRCRIAEGDKVQRNLACTELSRRRAAQLRAGLEGSLQRELGQDEERQPSRNFRGIQDPADDPNGQTTIISREKDAGPGALHGDYGNIHCEECSGSRRHYADHKSAGKVRTSHARGAVGRPLCEFRETAVY